MARPPHPRRRRTALVAATAALVLAGAAAGALAADRFLDVPPDSTHAASIGWAADAGVTAGCSDEAFCPDRPVSRAQMVTFLRNLAEAGVVDAATVEGRGVDGLRPADVTCGPGEALVAIADGAGVCGPVRQLTSPDGSFHVAVDDDGIVLRGPSGLRIDLDDSTVRVAGTTIDLDATGTVRVAGSAGAVITSTAITNVQGSLVTLNGACLPVARVTDPVAGGTIVSGSPTVLAC